MNKVLFSEGGQPIYLDDLRQIQSNGLSMNKSLLKALTGSDTPYLVEPYSYTVQNQEITVKANAVIYDGEIIPFEAATFNNGSTIYLCVAQNTSDLRAFKDGEERHCRICYRAYLSTETVGAIDSFEIAGMSNLLAVLAYRLYPRYTSMRLVYPDNAFGVSMSYCILNEQLRMRIHIFQAGAVDSASTMRVCYYSGSADISSYFSPIFSFGGKPCFLSLSGNQIYIRTIDGTNLPSTFGPIQLIFDIPLEHVTFD